MKLENTKFKEPTSKLDAIRVNDPSKNVVSVFNDDKKGEFYYIKTDNLMPYHKQARRVFDKQKIEELAVTIKEHGIRQPLTVIKSPTNPDKYEIISGERRFLAAKLVSLEKVPCIMLADSSRADEVALIENIQREDLHPIELGTAYEELAQKKGLSLNKLAEVLGVSGSSLKEHVQFASLEEQVKQLILQNNIYERKVLRKILSLKTEESRKKAVEAEIVKRTSNIGKRYTARQVTLFATAMINGKLVFEIKSLSKLTDSQKAEIRNFVSNILETL